MDRLDKIITTELLKEGYAAQRYSNDIMQITKLCYNFMKKCDRGEIPPCYISNGENLFRGKKTFTFNLQGFNINKNYRDIYGPNLDDQYTVEIIINYIPSYTTDTGVEGEVSGKREDTKEINLYVPGNATLDDLYQAILHEFTHVLDFCIKWSKDDQFAKFDNLKMYVHNDDAMTRYGVPRYMQRILYQLWDNSEFNAWQANYNLGGRRSLAEFIEILQDYIETAKAEPVEQEDETKPNYWANLQEYLTYHCRYTSLTNNIYLTLGDKKFASMSLPRLKKYFITTSERLLDKFRKKCMRNMKM